MKKRTIFTNVLCAVVAVLGAPVMVKAVGEEVSNAEGVAVIIADISPASKHSPSEEHVRLYNAGQHKVDITGWQLQYRSASHAVSDDKGWSTRAIIGCEKDSTNVQPCPAGEDGAVVIEPGNEVRLGSEGPTTSSYALTPGMATASGQLRLVGPASDATTQDPIVYDLVGYGAAKTYEGSGPAIAPKAGQGIVRLKDDNAFRDTGDNSKDFVLTPEEADPPEPGHGGGDVGYLSPVITEILPDPASPHTDSADEFIELYNPFDEAIDLDGYSIVTGSGWSRIFTIQDVTVDSGAYVVLTAEATHISLSNSGTGVRLLNPRGVVIFEVPNYGKALVGNSWAQDMNGQWVWTSEPTPGVANSIVVPPVKAAAPVSTKKVVATAAKPKKTTPSAKTSTKKAAASSAKTTAKAPGEGAAIEKQTGQANYIILAVAAAIAGGYILFEYRRDIAAYARTAWERAAGIFAKK